MHFLQLFACITIVACNANVEGPLTPHFQTFLSLGRFKKYFADFVRTDLANYGSYGGRTRIAQIGTVRQPVIFIHGNGDQALLDPSIGSSMTGWTLPIQYFQSQGWHSQNLYAMTWGAGVRGSSPSNTTHSCKNLLLIRNFIEAVIEYNGIPYVNVIAYDIGVTLTRKALLGGSHIDSDGSTCSLGTDISPFIRNFIGIGGMNQGMAACLDSTEPLCNDVDGLYPGTCNSTFCPGLPENASDVLKDIWSQSYLRKIEALGLFSFSFWSTADEVIGDNGLVWGEPTSRLPGQFGEWVSADMSHQQLKDDTGARQFKTVTTEKPASCAYSYCD